jgi:hypothetical protein
MYVAWLDTGNRTKRLQVHENAAKLEGRQQRDLG